MMRPIIDFTKIMNNKDKRLLREGLSVFTSNPNSTTHQKRIEKAYEDFRKALNNGDSKQYAIAITLRIAAGKNDAKYTEAIEKIEKVLPPTKKKKPSNARIMVFEGLSSAKTNIIHSVKWYFSNLAQKLRAAFENRRTETEDEGVDN